MENNQNAIASLRAMAYQQESRNAVARERGTDELKNNLRGLDEIIAEHQERVRQIAARLGYHGPAEKVSTDRAPSPVPNGSLEELRQAIASLHASQAALTPYLEAIERQV